MKKNSERKIKKVSEYKNEKKQAKKKKKKQLKWEERIEKYVWEKEGNRERQSECKKLVKRGRQRKTNNIRTIIYIKRYIKRKKINWWIDRWEQTKIDR